MLNINNLWGLLEKNCEHIVMNASILSTDV